MGFVNVLLRAVAVVLACALVAGCGEALSALDRGGGNGSNKTTLTNVNPDGSTGPAAGSVTGVAMDGRLRGGEVRLFGFGTGGKGNLVAAGQVDAEGRYLIDLKVISQPLLIEVSGGRYVEPTSGVAVDLEDGQVLLAVQNYRSGSALSVSLTHFTTVAAGLAESMVRMGVTPPNAVEASNQRIAAIAGLTSGFDALAAKPVDISNAASVTPFVTAELEYGFVSAALSPLTETASIIANRTIHESINSIALTQLALDDVRRDGVLDGQGAQGALAIGVTPISADIYRNTLALNVLRMAADTQGNKTSIDPKQVLPLAQRLNNSTDPIYGGKPIIPLNVDTPVIADLSIAANALLAGSPTFTVSATSLIGVAAVELLIDNVVVGTAPDPTKPSIRFDTTTINDGSHQLSVRATDLIGGVTTTPAFAVAISNAEGRISNISLGNNSIVRGTINVTADIVDNAGIAEVRYFVDNFQPVISADPRAPFRLDTVALRLADDLTHTLRITATNNLGREIASSVITFKVDNQPPSLAITSPSTGAFLSKKFTLATSATDNGTLGQIDLFVDAEAPPVANVTRVPDGFFIDTEDFPEGRRALSVRVQDQAGNDAMATVQVTFDNTAPTVVITSPAQNAAIRGAFDVVAALSDNFALGTTATILLDPTPDVAIGIDSTVLQTGEMQGTVRQRIEGTSIPNDGPHSYAVVARDRAGNTVRSASVNVRIDNTPPVISDLRVQLDQEGDCILSGSITDPSGISTATLVTQSGLFPMAPSVTNSLATPSFAIEVASRQFLFSTEIAATVSAADALGNTASRNATIRTITRTAFGGITGCSLEAASPASN